jgi:hypothetical protein
MLDDFLGWVTEQLEYYGLGRLISGTITLIAASAALSAVFGSAIIFGAVVASIGFLILLALIAVIRDHRRLRNTAASAHALLQRYCDIVEKISTAELDVSEWEQLVELDRRGNARVVRKITLTPVGGDLHFLRLRLMYYGGPDQSVRLRRRVRATARELSGARWESTWFWKNDRTHEVIVHFRNPIPEGRSISVEVEWTWPLFSSQLMAGGYEDFDIRFSHRVQRAKHMVVLPLPASGELPYVSPNSAIPQVERQGSTCRVTFEVNPCQQGIQYGVRIDKRGSPVAP